MIFNKFTSSSFPPLLQPAGSPVVLVGRESGLEIKRQKSTIVIFNMRDKPQEIAGIRTNNTLKYLGITINDSKNLFKEHKKLMMDKAVRLANMTYSVVARSCARMLVGKTYWKSIALPTILYGTNIMEFTKQELEKLQRIENSVTRKILRAPSYAQQAALRGEVGISSMKARIMEGQLKYLQYAMKGQGQGKELLSRVVEEMRASKNKNKWIMGLMESRNIVGLRGEADNPMEWDTRMWKQEMEEKVNLKLYKEWRENIGGQDNIYDNREAAVILFRCRTNNIDLGD